MTTKIGHRPTILVFAGSGASKAVNPNQFPTTVEFFSRLPESIKTNPLFVVTQNFLTEKLGTNAPIDIELLLWHLNELQTSAISINNPNNITGWMLQGHRLMNAVGHQNSNYGQLHSISSSTAERITYLVEAINRQVYTLYSQLPTEEELNNTWIPLLAPILKSGANVEIVTTNYDMILEVAIDQLVQSGTPSIDNGWRGAVYRTLDTDLWTNSTRSESTVGVLTKLHGSVNWSRADEKIHVSDPGFKGSHDRHAIIYPGFKGRPTDPIFQGFHSHFANTLSRATQAVFIGFAFRDEYINELCDRHLSPTTKVALIDPAKKINLPLKQKNQKIIQEFFNTESADKASHYLLSE